MNDIKTMIDIRDELQHEVNRSNIRQNELL